eukprot:jgi/Botrbrau1/16255/Bobra.0066s0040.1
MSNTQSADVTRHECCPGWAASRRSDSPRFVQWTTALGWAVIGATVALTVVGFQTSRPCQGEGSGSVVVQQAVRSWRSETRLPLILPGPKHGTKRVPTAQLSLNASRLKELQSLQVRALVFYGRRRNVRLLNSYLEPNLVSSGGILHEVVFVVRTADPVDLDYLRLLVDCHRGEYRAVFPKANQGEHQWARHYQGLRPNSLYIKIDDDIVFIQDGAIEALVEAKLRSRFLFLSANVVNHPLLSPVHARLGALLPFAPSVGESHWCASDDASACKLLKQPRKCSGYDCEWVLVRDEKGQPATLDGTVAANATYADPWTCFLWNWRCAAIVHHSFLHRWRERSLKAFEFSSWDFNYAAFDRWSINFFIFNSSDIPAPPLPTDDEVFLGQQLPEKLQRHCGAAGQATLVVHFGYYPQTEGLLRYTDVLSRYEEVARSISRGRDRCGLLIPRPYPG